MIYGMYSIKDKLNGYTSPIPMMNEQVAKRYFKDQMLGNPTMNNSKEDFELYHMGLFDTETGKFAQEEIKLVEKGVNYEQTRE